MACFKRYGNCYQRALPYVTSGFWSKPSWFDAMRRSPPDINLVYPKPKHVKFPEDDLYKALLIDKPLLELEVDKQASFQRTTGHRFAQRQYRLMQDDKVSEQEAYAQCEKEFDTEIRDLYDSLERVHADGTRRASFHTIKKNVSQHARVSETIAKLLEERIDMTQNRPFFPDPLEDKRDTRERRRARLKRLAEDPAIGYVRNLFRPQKPQILNALEVLVRHPDSTDTEFYNQELRNYFKKLGAALYAFDESQAVESVREEILRMKNSLSKLSYKVKTYQFSKLETEQQAAVLGLVQDAIKMKLIREATAPYLRISNFKQAASGRVRELTQSLSVEESQRPMQQILGKAYPMWKEAQWWKDSPERKEFLRQISKGIDG